MRKWQVAFVFRLYVSGGWSPEPLDSADKKAFRRDRKMESGKQKSRGRACNLSRQKFRSYYSE